MMLWAEGILAALLSFAAYKSCSRVGRIPFLCYYGGYFLTTVIGALVIYATQDDPLIRTFIFLGMDAGALPARLPDTYLHLLFLPFLVVSATLLLLRAAFRDGGKAQTLTPEATKDYPAAILLLLGACILYGLYSVIRVGLFPFGMFTAASGYESAILMRYAMVNALGNIYLSVTAVVIPTLAVALLAIYLRERNRLYLYALILAAAADFYFVSATFSKGGFVMLIVYLAAGWAALARIRPWILVSVGLGALILLSAATIWQSAVSSDQFGLAALGTVRDVIFRLAVSFPFFVLLFPSVLPSPGPDFGMSFFNIGAAYPLITTVNNYMYPSVTFAQGSVTAPSHLMSYAEAGWGWAVITLIVTGFMIFWVGRAAPHIRSSMGLAVFVATCISLYFTTQGGFYSTFQVYYGCLWAWLAFGAYHLLVWFDRTTSRTEL